MELTQLKYFKVVADKGKISTAAESLYISSPALSASISKLENELGISLFDRTHNSLTLNRNGKILLRYANQIFSLVDCARYELQHYELQRSYPHVSIAVSNSSLWGGLITAFSQTYPSYTLSNTSLQLHQLLDVNLVSQHAFLLAEEQDIPEKLMEKLESVFLFEDVPVLLVNEDNPLSKRTSISLKEITDQRMLLPMENMSIHNRVRELFEFNSIQFPTTNTYPYVISNKLVENNVGVSITSARTDNAFLPHVRQVPIESVPRKWVVRLYWHKDRDMTQADLTFRDFAISYYNQENSASI